ncbi:MAG: hypothetical protein PHV82_11505 [Victivallaceae bacterium]|nr:hypothetical protein [Victivallaceae bacterium]
MTDKDKKDIAQYIAEELKSHQPVIHCPNGITPEVAQGIKDFVNMINTSKKAATKAAVTFFVLIILALVVAGFWAKLGEHINKLTGK